MPVYRLEIYKAWDTRDTENEWSNTYEAFAANATVLRTEVVPKVYLAETQIHLGQVQFLRWSAAAYNANAGTLNPNDAPNGVFTGAGARSAGGFAPYDIEMAYHVKFTTEARAYGKKAYHGCLTEGDVTSTATGIAQLESNSTLQDFGLSWTDYSGQLEPLLTVLEGEPSLGAYTRFQTSPRGQLPKIYGPWGYYPFDATAPLKVGRVKMNHRWFNRSG